MFVLMKLQEIFFQIIMRKAHGFKLTQLKLVMKFYKLIGILTLNLKEFQCKNDIIFFDRGVHEITAYLRSIKIK